MKQLERASFNDGSKTDASEPCPRIPKKTIWEDIVSREGSSQVVGPANAAHFIEFASSYWRPVKADRQSDSLGRAIACIEKLARPV